MKKSILYTTAFLMLASCTRDVELKGIVMGSQYGGATKIETTVGGVEGRLSAYTEDSIVVNLSFYSDEDPSEAQLEKFIENINSNYDIELIKTASKALNDTTGYYFKAERSGCSFLLNSTGGLFMISDIKASEASNAKRKIELEKQKKKSPDKDF